MDLGSAVMVEREGMGRLVAECWLLAAWQAVWLRVSTSQEGGGREGQVGGRVGGWMGGGKAGPDGRNCHLGVLRGVGWGVKRFSNCFVSAARI